MLKLIQKWPWASPGGTYCWKADGGMGERSWAGCQAVLWLEASWGVWGWGVLGLCVAVMFGVVVFGAVCEAGVSGAEVCGAVCLQLGYLGP